VIVSNVLKLDINELSEREWRSLFQKMRYVANKEIYEPWKISPRDGSVILPRGAWSLIPDHVLYEDDRVFPEMPELEFEAVLDDTTPDGRSFEGQVDAVKSIMEQEQGLVIRPPGTGKTQIVLAVAAVLGSRTLILVHTEDILQQWLDRISDVIPTADVGVIRGQKFHVGHITVATVQTFKSRMLEDPTLTKEFGMVVLDEAHHAAASTFETILNEMHARYRVGVTATDKRADGRHPYMKLVIGPVIYRQKFKSKVPVKVVPIKRHKFNYRLRGTWDYRGLLDKLTTDERRNEVISLQADRMIQRGHAVLVLSREILHLQMIQAGMEEDCEILTSKRTKEERKEILERFRNGEIKCVLATQLADEALDVPILSCVILTFPGKHDGRIIQQVGRALREHPEKERAVIIDIVDDRVPVLRRQWQQRKSAYRKMGIPIQKRKLIKRGNS
jgi:superfamily II DNA or RNA helicase